MFRTARIFILALVGVGLSLPLWAASNPGEKWLRPKTVLQAPELKSAKLPRVRAALLSPEARESLVVQCIVDADGRPRAPVIVQGRDHIPSYLYRVLLSLREWRFAPARGPEGAVPVLWDVPISPLLVRIPPQTAGKDYFKGHPRQPPSTRHPGG